VNQANHFWDEVPTEFSSYPAALRPSASWLDCRRRLIVHEVSQLIASDYTGDSHSVRDSAAFQELQPGLHNRTVLSVHDKHRILDVLYFYGLPAVTPFPWDDLRRILSQTHISADAIRDYVLDVERQLVHYSPHWRGTWLSPERRLQLADQIQFFAQLRLAIVKGNLAQIEPVPWVDGPEFWSPCCDAALVRGLAVWGFCAMTRLVQDVAEHWPFELQKQIAPHVRRIRLKASVERWNRRPLDISAVPNIAGLQVLCDVPKVRRRVLDIIRNRCPETDIPAADINARLRILLCRKVPMPSLPTNVQNIHPDSPFPIPAGRGRREQLDMMRATFPTLAVEPPCPIAIDEALVPKSDLYMFNRFRAPDTAQRVPKSPAKTAAVAQPVFPNPTFAAAAAGRPIPMMPMAMGLLLSPPAAAPTPPPLAIWPHASDG
jgi:hypothetical protein